MSTARVHNPNQKKLLIALAVGELVLKIWAARDLAKRPRAEVRGSKKLWAPLLLVNFFGPLAYLKAGRRSLPDPADA